MKMNTILGAAIFLSVLGTVGTVQAHEHPPAAITGTGIALFERGHAFSGSILERAVFGVFEHDPFGGTIQIRKGEKTITLALAKDATAYQGVLSEVLENEETGETSTIETRLEMISIKKTSDIEAEILMKVDGNPVSVKVAGKTFTNSHFQEPTFEATIGGKVVAFHFTGESCFGYSTNIAMLIFGAYAHLSK